jgi:nickel/cobalt transporter (NicO) family protein
MRSAVFGFARALLFAGLSLIFFTSAAEAELKPISPFAATEVAPGPPAAFARPTAAPFQAPGPLGRVFAWVLDKQQSLQRTLAMSVKSLKTNNSIRGAITLAVLSFVYGVLHAVGPGHGKTIISSYVVANEETVRRGVIISFIAAGLQALTAVVLVGVLLIALGATGLQVNAWSNQLETISYAMIALVGLYLLSGQVRSVWRRWQVDRPVTVLEVRDGHAHSDHHHHHAHLSHDHQGHGDHHHDHHHHEPGEACNHIVDARQLLARFRGER